MGNLPESAIWADGVFQLETDTLALGGPDGPMNEQGKALANRTRYLKQEVESLGSSLALGVREAAMRDDAGNVHHMVYIPRLRIPAALLEVWGGGETWPPEDIELGGFFVDKYLCSHPAATPLIKGCNDGDPVAAEIAISRPGVVVWDRIHPAEAKQACENRTFNGRACHLITPTEWGTLLLLMQLNPAPRGNTGNRRDSRDPDQWEYRGVPDPNASGRCLVGTGPASWGHNGSHNGVHDLLGLQRELVDMNVYFARYQHELSAVLDDDGGISSGDVSVTLASPQKVEHWPAAGLARIAADGVNSEEYIRYTGITENGDGTWTLTGCLRGERGTDPAAHADGTDIYSVAEYCVLPGGGSGFVSGSGLDNDTDLESIVDVVELLFGAGGSALAAGRVLRAGDELLLVTDVSQADGVYTFTVTRGHAGTVKAAHADGGPIVLLNASNSLDAWDRQVGWVHSLRVEPRLLAHAFVGAVESAVNASLKDFCAIGTNGTVYVTRGGSSASEDQPDLLTGFYTETWSALDLSSSVRAAFRAAYSLE